MIKIDDRVFVTLKDEEDEQHYCLVISVNPLRLVILSEDKEGEIISDDILEITN